MATLFLVMRPLQNPALVQVEEKGSHVTSLCGISQMISSTPTSQGHPIPGQEDTSGREALRQETPGGLQTMLVFFRPREGSTPADLRPQVGAV